MIAQAFDAGILESVGQLVVAAGTVILFLMLVALAGFAYKSLTGDGIEWPDDADDSETEELERGTDDDEWKFS